MHALHVRAKEAALCEAEYFHANEATEPKKQNCDVCVVVALLARRFAFL